MNLRRQSNLCPESPSEPGTEDPRETAKKQCFLR